MTEAESIRIAMDQAWRDHHHTRDKTWKTLQIESLVFVIAGIVGVKWQPVSPEIIAAALGFVCIVVLCGIQIALHHRNNVEISKFKYITKCEEALGLKEDHLISDTKLPEKLKIWHAFDPRKGNASVFILRMHMAILIFALFIMAGKIFGWL